MTECCVLRKSSLSSVVLAMALFLSLTPLTSSAPTGKLLRILHFLRFRSVLFISRQVNPTKSLRCMMVNAKTNFSTKDKKIMNEKKVLLICIPRVIVKITPRHIF